MADRRLILAFDTSAAHCAVALLSDSRLIARRREEMTRGQAERLIPLIEELLSENAVTWGDLDLVGVGTGPGNFTGIRISVAAARGLGLSLGIPVIGVSNFDALRQNDSDPIALAAPRGFVYLQPSKQSEPVMLSPEKVGGASLSELPENIAQRIGQVASRQKTDPSDKPKPLYIRPADAAPARDTAPRIL